MKSIRSLFFRFLLPVFTIICLPVLSLAQAAGDDVEMADIMRSNGKIYVVISVLCVIFIGIVIYLVLIDWRLNKLEKGKDTR